MQSSVQSENPPFVWPGRGVVLIPAFNEAAALPRLLAEVQRELPALQAVVINDGSSDQTAAVARRADVHVLDLPYNLGVGGAIQVGFQFALHRGFDYALRLDADGQHP